MNSLKAMYGCGLNFFIKLAYNSLFLYKFAKSKDAYKFFTTTIIINLTLKDYAEKIVSYSRNVPDRNVNDRGVCTDAYCFWSR